MFPLDLEGARPDCCLGRTIHIVERSNFRQQLVGKCQWKRFPPAENLQLLASLPVCSKEKTPCDRRCLHDCCFCTVEHFCQCHPISSNILAGYDSTCSHKQWEEEFKGCNIKGQGSDCQEYILRGQSWLLAHRHHEIDHCAM